MQLQEDSSQGDYQIERYQPGAITINQKCYTRSLVIGLRCLITDWPPQSLCALTEAHLEAILVGINPELVLLGTGPHFKRPGEGIVDYFHQRGIGFEFMDTRAACHTFVALSSEGRAVAAGLLLG